MEKMVVIFNCFDVLQSEITLCCLIVFMLIFDTFNRELLERVEQVITYSVKTKSIL